MPLVRSSQEPRLVRSGAPKAARGPSSTLPARQPEDFLHARPVAANLHELAPNREVLPSEVRTMFVV